MRIRQLLYLGMVLLVAGCTEEGNLSDTLSGEGKTPLLIEASLSTGYNVTRAAGKDFATGDQLLAYLRHTTGGSLGSYTTTSADRAPLLLTFTKGELPMSYSSPTVNMTGDLTASPVAYWDDFSDSRNSSTDLRTTGHGLQSYYGYCYNGGTPSTALVAATGVLGWTIGNQATATDVQHADLLWSEEQETVSYFHSNGPTAPRYPLLIPYTHAMSEVTVTVTTDATYTSSAPLTSTALTLNAMNTVASLTAPTGAFTSSTPASISMFAHDYASGNTRNYTAIVAPGTKLKEDELLLSIVNVDNNNYSLNITSAMLAADKWATNHTTDEEGGKTYILTKPGYNYHLDITVSKTAIEVEATIQDWMTVNAEGTGVIQYPNDVVSMNVTGANYENNSSFSLFWQQANGSSNDDASERNNNSYNYATISTYSTTNSAWTNSPAIYWPNQTDNYYFRALAKFNSTTNNVHNISSVGTFSSDKGTTVLQGTIATGHDILWGTTPEHTGNPGASDERSFNTGQAIPPRTGDVPIAFEHAMSKVTFILETTGDEDDTTTPEYALVDDNHSKVDLRNSSIAISNLYTSGTITIEDGNITTADNKTADAISGSATNANLVKRLSVIEDYIVIPQAIGNESIVTITLKDQSNNVVATYRLQLNQCIDSDSNNNPQPTIGAWQRGKHYTYTIHLEKEQITFRALIQDWVEKSGSGNANLEWD